MLVLSPLRNSNAEDREGLSGAFPGDDFLDSIDFSCIFGGFDVDGGDDLFPAELPPEGEEQEKSRSPESEDKKDELTCATATATTTTVKRLHGKKKTKVDWTPELHRRFVQAVEQLGVDKAVPSKILELMGIQNLTRHNIASHLQKYRSHRKHLLAREAEAASWSKRRKIYAAGGAAAAGDANKSLIKKESSPWIVPTIGFPPPPSLHPQFRALHVWGHSTGDGRPAIAPAMWSGHTPTHPWPPQLPNYITYWQPHYHGGATEGWGPTAAPHFIPQPLPAMRYAPPPVAGVPPHPMYRSQHWVSPLKKHSNYLQAEHSDYPSKESIDAAIGDVLTKPWLPLPLGLKPPTTKSVLVELQRQGVSNVPPAGCNPEGN